MLFSYLTRLNHVHIWQMSPQLSYQCSVDDKSGIVAISKNGFRFHVVDNVLKEGLFCMIQGSKYQGHLDVEKWYKTQIHIHVFTRNFCTLMIKISVWLTLCFFSGESVCVSEHFQWKAHDGVTFSFHYITRANVLINVWSVWYFG